MMDGKVSVRVLRYDPTKDTDVRFETYEVPRFTDKLFVLDVLCHIREEYDHGLAFRYNCRHGHCGSCAVLVNGKPVLSCTTLVEDGLKSLTIEPLPRLPIIRDLVVDFDICQEKMHRLRLGLFRIRAPEREPEVVPRSSFLKYKEFSKCIDCLICMSACPVHDVKSSSFIGPLGLAKVGRRVHDPRDNEDRVRIAYGEGLYYCTTCANCYELCPKNVPIPRLAVEHVRSLAFNSGIGPLPAQSKFGEHAAREHNPYMEPHAGRLDWLPEAARLPVEAETVYFVGCTSSYRQRNIARATFEVLKKAGLNFTVLRDEWCCGSPLLRTGQTKYVREMAEHNVDAVDKARARVVVTTCAGCYRSWKLDYGEEYRDVLKVKHDFEVLHTTEVLEQLMGDGALTFRGKFEKRAAYHDPCHLGRHAKVYEPPRNVLKMVPGLELVEALRSRDNARCCGAGGGVKSGYPSVARELAYERLKDMEEVKAKAVVTSCPFCWRNFHDAVEEYKLTFDLYDVVEVVRSLI